METLCKICGGQHVTGACTEKEKVDDLKFQFFPKFESFTGGQADKEGKYSEPTAERGAEIERRLDQLGEIMAGAGFDYLLDGAINISLLKNKFIRDHKDVDISIVDQDLMALDEQIKKKGYVIVSAARDKATDSQRCLEIVSPQEIIERNLRELQLARIDDDGKILNDSKDINFIDLHVHHRDSVGNIVINYSKVNLPAKYFQENGRYQTASGYEIPISHPVVVAYHKVESGRDYDFTDIGYLKDLLSEEDKSFLLDLFEQEPKRALEQFTLKVKEIFSDINPQMPAEEIKSQLEKSGIGKDPRGRAFIEDFLKMLVAEPEMNEARFIAIVAEKFEIKIEIEKRKVQAKNKVDKLKEALGIKKST